MGRPFIRSVRRIGIVWKRRRQRTRGSAIHLALGRRSLRSQLALPLQEEVKSSLYYLPWRFRHSRGTRPVISGRFLAVVATADGNEGDITARGRLLSQALTTSQNHRHMSQTNISGHPRQNAGIANESKGITSTSFQSNESSFGHLR